VFGHFTQLVSEASGWAYGVVFLLAYLDVLVPVVPSEASVITAGVVASTGGLYLPLLIAVAACGAFLGDNTAYLIGRRYGTRATQRFLHGGKAEKTLAWAERQLTRRGGELIVVSRFIPGGRTAVTLAAGTLAFPWRRFAVFDAIAALIWAVYASLLGYFGGRAFENEAWKGLILALGLAFAVTGAVEAVRWYLRRRASRRSPGGASPDVQAAQAAPSPDQRPHSPK
jgi:membrane protein DedA with SNARE-associated domain